MKIIKTIIILLLFIGCSENKNRITEFDKVLGKENIKTLNLLVSDFENDFLKRQYPNLDIEESYMKFLTESSEGKTEYAKVRTEKSKNIFNKSQLRLDMFCIADSTWIETNPWNDKTLLVKARTRCKNQDGTFEIGAMEMPFDVKEVSKDSILKNYMNFVKSNQNGKYLKALNSIKNKSDFLKSFVSLKNDFGILVSYEIAKMMLESNVNVNDPFIRKIIVLEILH